MAHPANFRLAQAWRKRAKQEQEQPNQVNHSEPKPAQTNLPKELKESKETRSLKTRSNIIHEQTEQS
jgi:hypothetical protein